MTTDMKPADLEPESDHRWTISAIALAFGLVLGAATLAQTPSANPKVPTYRLWDTAADPYPWPKVALLQRESVQEELKVTEAQRERQAAIQRRQAERRKAALSKADREMTRATRSQADREKLQAAFMAAREETEAALVADLEPGQRDRLDQIQLQVEGPLAFARPEVCRRLGMSDMQTERARAIAEEGRAEMLKASQVPLGVKPGDEPTSQEGVRKLAESQEFQAAKAKARRALLASREETARRIDAVLSEPQRAAYRASLGPPFDLAKLRPGGEGATDDVAAVARALGLSGQRADPSFDTRVARPAYVERHPRVLFDEAHRNFHTASGRYKPFVDLIGNDGYEVVPNREAFTKEGLARGDVLIIANATSGDESSAFNAAECDAVRDWVEAGGALLLITDHPPYGTAAADLAKRFGVEMSGGATWDPAHTDPKDLSGLSFTRENRLLGDHPITRGRDESERVNRVLTFLGQSLKGPEGSIAFLKLADTAVDRVPASDKEISAAGRSQGVAFAFGKGRVVVLGEAAQLSAQVAGFPPEPFGMNVPGIDNRRMALNIMHWLSGLIGP